MRHHSLLLITCRLSEIFPASTAVSVCSHISSTKSQPPFSFNSRSLILASYATAHNRSGVKCLLYPYKDQENQHLKVQNNLIEHTAVFKPTGGMEVWRSCAVIIINITHTNLVEYKQLWGHIVWEQLNVDGPSALVFFS